MGQKLYLVWGMEVCWELRKNFKEERTFEADPERSVALTARAREGVHIGGESRAKAEGWDSSGQDPEQPVVAGARTPSRKVVGTKPEEMAVGHCTEAFVGEGKVFLCPLRVPGLV